MDGLPAVCSGKAKKTRPRTPSSGASACACEVIRPPNERPPANSGSDRREPPRLGDRGAHRGVGDRRRIDPLAALLHVGELVAQRGDAALGEAVGDRRHRPVRHPGAGAVGQHQAGGRRRRRLPEARDGRAVRDRDPDWLPRPCERP